MAFDVVPLSPEYDPLASALAGIGEESPSLAACARRWSNAFRLHSRVAPGFVFVGAMVLLHPDEAEAFGARAISVAGNGGDYARALTSCLGETADLLSQAARPDEALADGSIVWRVGWIGEAMARARRERPLAAIPGAIAASSEMVLLPADLVLRRAPGVRAIEPVGPLSAGCAAGPDREAAALRAMLELVERDAAALWWLGGKRPRAFGSDHPAVVAADATLAAWRQGVDARPTRLLDITTELGIPCVAAVSTDPNGFGLACGLAARLDAAEAAEAALGELCQMELAAPLAEAKRAARGEDALGAVDRRHLERTAFPTAACALLAPAPDMIAEPAIAGVTTAAELARHLAGFGIDVALVELTRPDIGVPVMRAMAGALQPFAEEVRTPRLRLVQACCGDAQALTRGVPLM